MSFIFKVSFSAIASASLFWAACIAQKGDNYDIDKVSPNGMYLAKIVIRAEEGKNNTRGYIEHGKCLFFKGQQIIETYEWKNPYAYEPTFRQSMPIIEWVDDAVLRLGEDRSKQPFFDELIILNNTQKELKYVSISYGKSESFWIFDVAPGSQVKLSASPGFYPDGTSRYFLGYGGMTQNGEKFEGTMESKQRKSPDDGSLKFQISINEKDLR